MNDIIGKQDIVNYIVKLSIDTKISLGLHYYRVIDDNVYITLYNSKEVYPRSREIMVKKTEIIALQREKKLKEIFK